MTNDSLETSVGGVSSVKTEGEDTYLNSMMSEARQEEYTCVSGCSNCCSCGGNDYIPEI